MVDPEGLAPFPNEGPIPGTQGGHYRIDLREEPNPDLHLFWDKKETEETNVTLRGGWRRGRHRGHNLIPVPEAHRQAAREIIGEFLKKVREQQRAQQARTCPMPRLGPHAHPHLLPQTPVPGLATHRGATVRPESTLQQWLRRVKEGFRRLGDLIRGFRPHLPPIIPLPAPGPIPFPEAPVPVPAL